MLKDKPVVHLRRLADAEDIAEDILMLAVQLYKVRPDGDVAGLHRQAPTREAKLARMDPRFHGGPY